MAKDVSASIRFRKKWRIALEDRRIRYFGAPSSGPPFFFSRIPCVSPIRPLSCCTRSSKSRLKAIEDAKERGLAPAEVPADSLYCSEKNVAAAAAMGTEVVAPVPGGEKKGKSAQLSEFTLTEEGGIERCPEGHAPIEDVARGNHREVVFSVGHCFGCPRRKECPIKSVRRGYGFSYDRKQVKMARRRAREKTEKFRDRYRFRAGIEREPSRPWIVELGSSTSASEACPPCGLPWCLRCRDSISSGRRLFGGRKTGKDPLSAGYFPAFSTECCPFTVNSCTWFARSSTNWFHTRFPPDFGQQRQRDFLRGHHISPLQHRHNDGIYTTCGRRSYRLRSFASPA